MAVTTALLFPWKDTYSVKIGVIDVQHRGLVNYLNELHLAMVEGRGKETLGKILANLIKYTQNHFATEERLLQLHGYPDYTSHKAEHDHLTTKVLGFQTRFQANEVGLTLDVMEFLKDWLSHHILGSDQKYSPFLNAQGVF